MPYPECEFEDGTALVNGVCIWTISDDQTGIWKVSLDPTPPKKENRPIDAQVAVRDGVPGNWCVLPNGSGGVFSERWKKGDGPVDGKVYLPGDENLPELEEGWCLAGGAGGEHFATGNPHSFYLRANGIITVTREDSP